MTILEMPTHPVVNPKEPLPIQILTAAMAISNTPTPTETTYLKRTLLRRGVGR